MKSIKPSKGQPIPDGWFRDLWQDVKSNEITVDQFIDKIKTKQGTTLTVNIDALVRAMEVASSGSGSVESSMYPQLKPGYFFNVEELTEDVLFSISTVIDGYNVKVQNPYNAPGSKTVVSIFAYAYPFYVSENAWKGIFASMYQTFDAGVAPITPLPSVGPRIVHGLAMSEAAKEDIHIQNNCVCGLGRIIFETNADGTKHWYIDFAPVEIYLARTWAAGLKYRYKQCIPYFGSTCIYYSDATNRISNVILDTSVTQPTSCDTLPMADWSDPNYGEVSFGWAKDGDNMLSLLKNSPLITDENYLSRTQVSRVVNLDGSHYIWVPIDSYAKDYGDYSIGKEDAVITDSYGNTFTWIDGVLR